VCSISLSRVSAWGESVVLSQFSFALRAECESVVTVVMVVSAGGGEEVNDRLDDARRVLMCVCVCVCVMSTEANNVWSLPVQIVTRFNTDSTKSCHRLPRHQQSPTLQ
jgi:hypothetical protein